MRHGSAAFSVVLGSMFLLAPAIFGQAAQPTARMEGNTDSSARDLSGVWVMKSGQDSSFLTEAHQEPPLTAWGREQFKATKSADEKKHATATSENDPHRLCDPVGMPRIDLTQLPIEIVGTSDETYIFYEEDHSWRQIYMDGRALPKDPDSSYLGYSVGKWDGDTLVVDTVGLNDTTWLDGAGHPHSDALHVVERLRRTGPDALQINVTIEDPKAYNKPWTSAPRLFQSKPGYELAEDYCVAPDSLGERQATRPSASPDK